MTTKTFNISALSPVLVYDPKQDVSVNSVWKSDPGSLVNGDANTGDPGRLLDGTGTVTIEGFGSGLGFAGSIQGVYCSYTATLSPGQGNTQDTSSLPAAQTSPPATGMLASFTGLDINNWQLQLEGNCDSGSFLRITQGVVDGWIGVQGGTISNQTLDDTSSQLMYSGVDWSEDGGLSAPFYDDSQHYTGVDGATMNITFSGSAIIIWASVDGQHGPYSVEIHRNSSSYNTKNVEQLSGYNPFLAVPVPFYFATGLDPNQRYTVVLENTSTNGSYLDLDYVEIYTSTGGGPPNNGTSALQPGQDGSGGTSTGTSSGSSNSNSNKTAIIAGAVGGGVILLLLIIIILLWRRRKTRVDRRGGVRPLDDNKRSSIGHSSIPMHLQGNILPNPYNPHQQQQYAAERQGLLNPMGTGHGSPTFPPTGAPGSVITSSSGYDPYAAHGIDYPSPPPSMYTGLASNSADHVQARRLGKAAEVEAARERMRVANAGSIASPTTPGPTHSTFSGDDTSHAPSSHPNAQPEHAKTPEEPPPEYE